ncbi:hypothetical protein LTR56_026091 [Elasticomyces elasticus]|nr:hypothetical protein LTR56_026091 [Elasticomyces elasticus]KAK3618464.1 hypothetical protein LTR22_026371 [Elasticomyces elasticus]KAK4903819.1 hypothetical protein LTR49_026619 [Elasticomyces elasticus]KAK5738099.1 hypothetical protein LTS12_025691 [Elasticomyces elasticus]
MDVQRYSSFKTFWIIFSVLEQVSEIPGWVMLYFAWIWMKSNRWKLVVFLFRLLLIAPAALRCRAIHPLQFSEDLAFYSVEFLAWSQIQMGSSMILAALPTCVGVLLSLDTGFGAMSDVHELHSMASQRLRPDLEAGSCQFVVHVAKSSSGCHDGAESQRGILRETDGAESQHGILRETEIPVAGMDTGGDTDAYEATARRFGDT